MLLAIALQKWMESLDKKDSRYNNPLESDGVYISFICVKHELGSDEYRNAVKKLNDHLSEKYDISPFLAINGIAENLAESK